jgi:nitrite reductase/ring-hydroxylating ferredoxin subunit
VARDERLICASDALVEGGAGVRFELRATAGEVRGFVVRHRGAACAYVNRCPHVGTELDWQPGEFFDESGLYLVCSTHGALFQPGNGFCVAGPCRGASLEPLEIRERDGEVILLNDTPANLTHGTNTR